MGAYNPFSADVEPAATTRKVRRLVTGVNADGRSTIVDDSVVRGKVGHATPTYVATDVWRTESSPADNTSPYADPVAGDEARSVGPSKNGSVFRILELPPDQEWRFDTDGKEVKPLAFHTTESIDYAIVLNGEIWAVLDETEVRMTAGDVLVQRGTAHAWANRSQEPCVLAFVLIGGTLPD
ncbi:cupin domain-containing protein [Streptomyces mayonensis]|uniref:cupin domain-containing protein n=1 Tax=Streptomyces mayonensis TaxID=2750816 RepID=UPI001C1DD155|nr:cupin domain-containing protein [Streptomyces sp. A108]MBU6529600.1 cupin domain-containing protein [Streptomyces sp. A108]